MSYAPIARIILRYGAGALVTYGLLSQEAAEQVAVDPDIAVIVGMAIGAGVEAVYALARKNGWAK